MREYCSGVYSPAYLDLEEPILEVTYMAGIVRDLAWELLDGDAPRKVDEDVITRMSKRQHEQLLFALEKAHDVAQDLEKIYHAK